MKSSITVSLLQKIITSSSSFTYLDEESEVIFDEDSGSLYLSGD